MTNRIPWGPDSPDHDAPDQARELLSALLSHEPDNICAGIPDAAIEAGIAAWDAARADLENYVSGVTPDWDEGMIVAAIFKAVARSAIPSAAYLKGAA